MKKAVTYDQLIDMLKAMKDADTIDSIDVEECMGGSLEIFVSAKNVEETITLYTDVTEEQMIEIFKKGV